MTNVRHEEKHHLISTYCVCINYLKKTYTLNDVEATACAPIMGKPTF